MTLQENSWPLFPQIYEAIALLCDTALHPECRLAHQEIVNWECCLIYIIAVPVTFGREVGRPASDNLL